MGALTDGRVAPLLTQVYVQSLAVDAAVKGLRELALQALLDELLEVHAGYLLQFMM